MEEQKFCDYCKRYHPKSFFGIALTKNSKIYRRRKCSNCYKLTKKKLIEKYLAWLNIYKSKRGCIRCKIKDPRILDFHHKNESDKKFTLGTFRRSVGFNQIQNEVKKCEVICANCHRIVHYEKRVKSTNIGVSYTGSTIALGAIRQGSIPCTPTKKFKI